MAVACGKLEPDFNQIVALEVALPDSSNVEIGDTLFPHARAVDGRGDSVAAAITWASFNPDTLEVVDSTTGAAVGKIYGPGRLQARVGAPPLRTNVLTIRVQTAADSGAAAGAARVTVTAPDSLSDSLKVQLFATPGEAANRLGRRVSYAAATYQSGGPTVRLVPRDTVLTGGTGIAFARVRLVGGTLPDSVRVTATARRADGSDVPGTPVTFVVEFRP